MAKILIADDNDETCQLISTMLSVANQLYEVETALTKGELFAKIAVMEPDLIILDAMFGSDEGRLICKFLKQNFLNIRVIIITERIEYQQKRDSWCADSYFDKPFKMKNLLKIVEEVLAKPAVLYHQ